MSSTRTGEASRLTSALTSANLALSIAREATDAVPIVKQVLGAALRIVGLAEKMDNDREALRSLGASSLQLAQQVTAVMAGKTPNDGIQASLERILKALGDIESFMKQHAARGRLRRFISYAFTVPQHVKRLSGELADAVRDLTVIVLLATHAAVQDSVRFEGKFRLLRDCEVDKLELIGEQLIGDNSIARYHRAKVHGELLVVRYSEELFPQHSSSGRTHQEMMFNHITVHDSILEEISSVQKSHRNVARIYGWSQGSGRDRFTVLKSGYHSVDNVLRNCPNPLVTGIHWTLKLIDAWLHLYSMGIYWHPVVDMHDIKRQIVDFSPYVLDDQLQPMIGFRDLGRRNQFMDPSFLSHNLIVNMTHKLWPFVVRQSVPAAKIQKLLAKCLNKRLADLLARMELLHGKRFVFPKDGLSESRILTDNAAKGLLFVLNREVFDDKWHDRSWMWASILLASDKSRGHPLMGRL